MTRTKKAVFRHGKQSSGGKKRAAEDYESEDGFVANGSDNSAGPKSKKVKQEVKGKDKKAVHAKGGEEIWELSGKRRVSVDLYNGKTMINIREYYEKDGQMLPGKKGIALSIEQYNALLSTLPEIELALIAKGDTVERPAYDAKPVPQTNGADEDNEEVPIKSEQKPKKKKNFEETSEEDQEDDEDEE